MEILQGNVIKIAGFELDGFSYVKIPAGADYAIVKKEGEENFRIINSSGKISKPFTEIFDKYPAGYDVMNGLILVKDSDPEKPYRFVDDTGTFSERYADVSCVETTHKIDKKTGEMCAYDKSGKKYSEKSVVSVKKSQNEPWIPITKEFINLPYMDMATEPAHFYCKPDTDREMMFDLRFSDGSRAYARHFANKQFAIGMRIRFEKQLKAELTQSENEYFSSNRNRQREIESAGQYYLVSHLDKCMENVDKAIADQQQEARKLTEQNIRLQIEKGKLHERAAKLTL